MLKTMKKSRLALLVCVLVLAVVMTTMLALGVFADEATNKLDSYTVSIGDGINVVVKGTTAEAEAEVTIGYQFEKSDLVLINTKSDANKAFSVTIPVGPGQIGYELQIAGILGTYKTMAEIEDALRESEEDAFGDASVSVKNYCIAQINNENASAALKQVCADVLLFGQASLEYLGNADAAAALVEGLELTGTPYVDPIKYLETVPSTPVEGQTDTISKVALKVTDRYTLVFKDADGNELASKTVRIPSIWKEYAVKTADADNNIYAKSTKKTNFRRLFLFFVTFPKSLIV